MINFDNVAKENIKENNPKWPQIPDSPYIQSSDILTSKLRVTS